MSNSVKTGMLSLRSFLRMVQYTRAENQAMPKAAFGFRRDNEQTVCEADGKRRKQWKNGL